jgi:hypothetical protein
MNSTVYSSTSKLIQMNLSYSEKWIPQFVPCCFFPEATCLVYLCVQWIAVCIMWNKIWMEIRKKMNLLLRCIAWLRVACFAVCRRWGCVIRDTYSYSLAVPVYAYYGIHDKYLPFTVSQKWEPIFFCKFCVKWSHFCYIGLKGI